jgi:hypothetical protein
VVLQITKFGKEFIAMHITVEMIEALHNTLHMIGVPYERLTRVFCDNKLLVTDSTSYGPPPF